jgi:thiol-disulfide isomerase/thioredoxin
MIMLQLLLLLLLLLLLSQDLPTTQAVPLTIDNFGTITKGKMVFLKLYTPWCGHCRAMADDWAKLEEDWKDHDVALIGDVDCTSEGGKPICEEYFQVEGFPTLVYGDPLAAEVYEGPRDYESLSAHAKAHISEPVCSVFRIEACSDDERILMKSLQAMSDEELEAMVQKVADLVQLEETLFDEKVQVVQQQYDALVTDFNSKLDDIKNKHNYKFVEQVMTARLADSLDENVDGGVDIDNEF